MKSATKSEADHLAGRLADAGFSSAALHGDLPQGARTRTIRALREEGATIILVEQMAAVALRLADRAYVLENGQIKLSGTGAELAHTPEVRRAYLGG